MDIQWFPGHMAKAKRLLNEKLKLINVAIIVVDARAPLSTFNPDLKDMLAGKQCIVVLNKCDLANDALTKKWTQHYQDLYGNAVAFSAVRYKKDVLLSAVNQAAIPIIRKYADKGMKKTIRVLIAGIPNVGKSAIINRLVGRKGVKEGDKPGVTKGLQWVRLSDSLELLDSPGLLWPKIDSESASVKIAVTGCIRQEIIDIPALAIRLIDMLKSVAPGIIAARYGIEDGGDAAEMLKEICKKRGFLLRRGEIDTERGAKTLLDEFKGGWLGKVTLESPDHFV
ncbi:MAG: ribosome biogenesis GTPase YlqF [Christensenellales bacterium]|jgi:ribosome biogenesis GTPase A